MELAQGGSLRCALDDKALALPWPLRIRLLLGVAEGMRHLHRADAGHRPIVHRDLKAANVLLSSKDLQQAVSAQGDRTFGRARGHTEPLPVHGQKSLCEGQCEQSVAGERGSTASCRR